MLKGNFVFQCLLYEECLSNTAPAIYCNKLWAVAMVEPVQLLDFFFLPTMVLIIALICRKDRKNNTNGKIKPCLFCRMLIFLCRLELLSGI